MRCAQFRKFIKALQDEEISPHMREQLVEHSNVCSKCREYAAWMNQVTKLLGKLPRHKLPADFSATVMARLAQSRQQRRCWLRGLWGDLRAPLPLLRPGTVAMAGIVLSLAVAGGVIALRPSASATHVAMFNDSSLSPAAVETVELTPEIIDQLVLQHQGYVSSQPLGDDAGIHMVSYTPGQAHER